jgi:arylsulfatase A-like enzyme
MRPSDFRTIVEPPSDVLVRSSRRCVLGVLVLGLASGCRDRTVPHVEGPHVVVVLVDQLRKDSADRWAPRTSALAERGVRFESMRSVAPWTYPSVISLMSGLYPQQHGADGELDGRRLTTFDSAVPLLPGLLQRAGYRTAAFVTNPFLHEWNPFHEDFDHYDVGFVGSQGNLRGMADEVWTEDMFGDAVNAAVTRHYDGTALTRPEFTYVHYIDVHGPWKGAPFEGDYASAVRYTDERVVELYDYFARRYDDDLLFFVTSDHGQELGDDERVGYGPKFRRSKGSMHDFNLRVPFLVLPGKHVPEGVSIDAPTSSVDFAPTLLEWLGVEHAHPLPGRSLLGAIRGEAPDTERTLYATVSAFGKWSECVVRGDRKYMRFFQVPDGAVRARRVFDLDDDPREVRALDDLPADFRTLLNEAAGDRGYAFEAHLDDVDRDLERELQALGYLSDE